MLPIVARLQSLQAASRFAPGGGRIIAEAQDRNPLARLLRTANETVLARSLRFDSASGTSLTLDVAGRRILRLTAAEGLPGAESCLEVGALEDEHKDALIKLLQAVAAPRHELRVTSGPIGRGGEEVSVGLPVALLADLVLIELNDSTQDQAADAAATQSEASAVIGSGAGLAGFADSLGPELIAWLILGGEDDGRSDGPEEMVSHLQDFLEDERGSVDRQLDLLAASPGGPICMILGTALVEGHSILCARTETALLLGVVEGDALRAAQAAWAAIAR